MAETETAEPAQGFAALMSEAATAAAPDAQEAPFGWTIDSKTGERRPKKAAGRPRRSPSIDELKADKEAAAAADDEGQAAEAERPADRAPNEKRRGGSPRAAAAAGAKEDTRVPPMPREGHIAKGVNKLYRRAGGIIKAMDHDIGVAVIAITRKEDDEDVTVGEAWEEVCRTNPRIRSFVLKVIAGGAWGQLVMAHAPVLLAIILKESIYKHIPLAKLMAAFFGYDEDDPGPTPSGPIVPGEVIKDDKPAGGGAGRGNAPGPFGGLTPDDMAQMANLAQKMMPDLAGALSGSGRSRATGHTRDPSG